MTGCTYVMSRTERNSNGGMQEDFNASNFPTTGSLQCESVGVRWRSRWCNQNLSAPFLSGRTLHYLITLGNSLYQECNECNRTFRYWLGKCNGFSLQVMESVSHTQKCIYSIDTEDNNTINSAYFHTHTR